MSPTQMPENVFLCSHGERTVERTRRAIHVLFDDIAPARCWMILAAAHEAQEERWSGCERDKSPDQASQGQNPSLSDACPIEPF